MVYEIVWYRMGMMCMGWFSRYVMGWNDMHGIEDMDMLLYGYDVL
jgi:hypothetical protein